jgi:ribonuclease Z
MKVTFLGTGAAFPDPLRGQSGILLTLGNGRHFLFDCGAGTTRQLVCAGVNPADVGLVCLTHLHHDHICDYPAFVITGWMFDRPGSSILLGPVGVRHFSQHLFEGGAFKGDFDARSHYPSRQANIAAIRPDIREMAPGVVYEDEDIRIIADLVDHIPRELSQCFGVRIEAEGKVVAFSGDTAPCEAMVRLAEGADLLIHECTFPESFIEFRKRTGVGIHAHTGPADLGQIAVRAGVKFLIPTHFGHFDSTSPVLKHAARNHFPIAEMGPHLFDEMARDIRRSYSGPLTFAHDLMRVEL